MWVPTAEAVYVAPEMVVHYVTDHGYLPPDEFRRAVTDCPPQGSPEFMRLLAPYLSYFGTTPPDPLPTPAQQVRLGKLLTTALYDIARLCRGGEAAAAAVPATAPAPTSRRGAYAEPRSRATGGGRGRRWGATGG